MDGIISASEAGKMIGVMISFSPASIIVLGGERMSCCDEAVVLEDGNGNLVGMATIAPRGESGEGKPAIVGLYVLPRFRRQGYAKELLLKTIERCIERGFEKICLDVMSRRLMRVITKLPSDKRDRLEVNDQSKLMSIDGLAEMEE